MSHDASRPIKVTAEERAHPAIRLLARACIALAQEQISRKKSEEQAEAGETRPGRTNGQADTPSQASHLAKKPKKNPASSDSQPEASHD